MSSPFESVKLIPVRIDELPLVNEMAAKIWPDAYREINSPEQTSHMLELMYSPQAMEQDLADGVIYQWILCQDEPVGFIAAGPIISGEPCVLHKCYVLNEAQGSGYGKAALRLLFKRLCKKGTTLVRLRVNRKNSRAIRFYQSLGFSVESEDILDIGGGFVMDDYIMIRYLT